MHRDTKSARKVRNVRNHAINALNKKTLDIHHSNSMDQIQICIQEKQKLQNEIAGLQETVRKLELKARENPLADADVRLLIQSKDDLIDKKDMLKALNNKINEADYFTNTAPILYKYYDLVDNGKGSLLEDGLEPKAHSINNIMKYFQARDQESQESNGSSQREDVEQNRGSLLDKYMEYTCDDFVKDLPICHDPKCTYCKSSEVVVMNNEGYIYCSSCKSIEPIIVDHDKPSYKDPPKEISYFSYKRQNHLNEWLAQIQGKETTEVPDEIYDKILLEIKKQRIQNMAELSHEKVKSILKKLKCNKWYEHIPHIMNRLNGLPTPHLPPDLEQKIRNMFKMIQTPYLKHAPPGRKNFLSYSFTIRKCLELLEKDEYLEHFKFLKSREKLHQQDLIWQRICNDLGWQFIPSL